jgi:hypothetical protein
MEEHKFTVILTIMMALVITSQAENLGVSLCLEFMFAALAIA